MSLAAATLAVNVLDAKSLIEAFGTIGVFVIIFAETGILVGLFLPGDSLLFTAGVFCAANAPGQVHLNLAAILVGTAVAAVAGGEVGYLLGRKAGPPLFRRPDSRIFKQAYVDRAGEFFTRYGPAKGILLARFVPIVRTFLNPFAGVAGVPPRTFSLWNTVGGVGWTVVVTMLGYALGTSLPKGKSIDTFLLPVIAVIVVISLIPIALEIRKQRRGHRTVDSEG